MPILTNDKIYFHMPKTGGTWITECLKREIDGRHIGPHGHSPSRDLKRHEIRDKTLWGTIRDPWSWYVSWWAHCMKNEQTKRQLTVYGGGSSDFKDVLEGVLARDPERCPENHAVMWGTSKPVEDRRKYLSGEGGLYTWTFFHMYEDVKILVDIQQMSAGLHSLMGIEPMDPPSNTRSNKIPKPPRKMYTDNMSDSIYDEEGFIISLLGYEEPFSTLSSPVVKV
jgi:hypothetical protein